MSASLTARTRVLPTLPWEYPDSAPTSDTWYERCVASTHWEHSGGGYMEVYHMRRASHALRYQVRMVNWSDGYAPQVLCSAPLLSEAISLAESLTLR